MLKFKYLIPGVRLCRGRSPGIRYPDPHRYDNVAPWQTKPHVWLTIAISTSPQLYHSWRMGCESWTLTEDVMRKLNGYNSQMLSRSIKLHALSLHSSPHTDPDNWPVSPIYPYNDTHSKHMNETYLHTPNTQNLNDIPQNITINNEWYIHNIQLQTPLNMTHILYQYQLQIQKIKNIYTYIYPHITKYSSNWSDIRSALGN